MLAPEVAAKYAAMADMIEERLSFIDAADRPVAREIIKAYRDGEPRAWGMRHRHHQDAVRRIIECLNNSLTK